MKRTIIAAVWIVGATIPLLAAVVFVFGCCVLPFHSYIHKVMPVCEIAIDLMHGEAADHEQGTSHQPVPVRERQEPARRIASALPRTFHITASSPAPSAPAAVDASGYRSFISLGALRCDQDIGLHLLVGVILI